MKRIIVIGAGQSAASLCSKLRSEGYDEEILLFGEERFLPYQRPPLSKKYLMGAQSLERLYIRPERYYTDNKIDTKLGFAVSNINPKEKKIYINNTYFSYDELVLTTGSSPRKLSRTASNDLENIFYVRSITDIDSMRPSMIAEKKVLIVGGGYIGLEAASVCQKLGLSVTLVEMNDRILNRVSSAQTSDYFRDLHVQHGVKIKEGVSLNHLSGEKKVSRATFSDSTEIDIDFVIVGIGILPNDSLAREAGLDIDNGIKTNALCQTSNKHIWAAGDCASFPLNESRTRLESVQNSIDQAELVARNILGAEEIYKPLPWFWSDQYDIKLQIAGLNTGYDQVVKRVHENTNTLSHWYYKNQKLLSVDAMNDPRSYMIAKRLIDSCKTVDPKVVEDPSQDLKRFLEN